MKKEKFFPGTNPRLVKKKVIVEEDRDFYRKINELRSAERGKKENLERY